MDIHGPRNGKAVKPNAHGPVNLGPHETQTGVQKAQMPPHQGCPKGSLSPKRHCCSKPALQRLHTLRAPAQKFRIWSERYSKIVSLLGHVTGISAFDPRHVFVRWCRDKTDDPQQLTTDNIIAAILWTGSILSLYGHRLIDRLILIIGIPTCPPGPSRAALIVERCS